MIELLASILMTLATSDSGTLGHVIGLLTVPQVLGAGPCVPFEPETVPLFAAPGAAVPVASIKVDENWTFPADGGCEGLKVRIHEEGRLPEELATEEFAYEAPAAIVVARKGDWFQLQTPGRPLWLHGRAPNVYYPLVKLLSEGAAHLTRDWDGSIFAAPSKSRLSPSGMTSEDGVEVLGSRTVSRELWLLVETTTHCRLPDEAERPRTRGWIRAYGKTGAPAVWFYSRGC
jgi:hypothetical protein